MLALTARLLVPVASPAQDVAAIKIRLPAIGIPAARALAICISAFVGDGLSRRQARRSDRVNKPALFDTTGYDLTSSPSNCKWRWLAGDPLQRDTQAPMRDTLPDSPKAALAHDACIRRRVKPQPRNLGRVDPHETTTSHLARLGTQGMSAVYACGIGTRRRGLITTTTAARSTLIGCRPVRRGSRCARALRKWVSTRLAFSTCQMSPLTCQ